MAKGPIHEKESTIADTYVPENRARKTRSKKEKTKLREVETSTIIAGNFDTPLSIMDITVRQKISKEIKNFKKTIYQSSRTDVYRTRHPRAAEDTFFSRAWGTLSGADHGLHHAYATVHLRRLKSNRICAPTTME